MYLALFYRYIFDIGREKYNYVVRTYLKGEVSMVITLYAGILGLIYLALSAFIVMGRFKYRVSMNDGGQTDLLKRIRMHGNFAEYVPFALILIFLAEQEGAPETLLHILGAVLILGRLMHLLGLYQVPDGTSIRRAGGVVITFLVIFVASIYCIQSYFIY